MQVIQGVKPDEQLVKVVHDEMKELLGSRRTDLVKPKIGPRVVLLAGLQGVGKTTACGKMAKYLTDNDEDVLVVSTDVYRYLFVPFTTLQRALIRFTHFRCLLHAAEMLCEVIHLYYCVCVLVHSLLGCRSHIFESSITPRELLSTCCNSDSASIVLHSRFRYFRQLNHSQGASVNSNSTSIVCCRPAAIDQLETLCKSINVDFLRLPTDGGPAAMAAEALKVAKKRGKQALLIDTAGRLQADEDMMQELKDIKAKTKPSDTLLVVDAMTGQEAAQVRDCTFYCCSSKCY